MKSRVEKVLYIEAKSTKFMMNFKVSITSTRKGNVEEEIGEVSRNRRTLKNSDNLKEDHNEVLESGFCHFMLSKMEGV